MLKCKINNQEVEVEEGTTVMEAFKKSGQEIAHYCWHPGLSVAGVCRLCLVEVDGNPKLQIACNTKVQEGMEISNQTPAVKEAVKWGLNFHLVNHPLDCPICDQAGECGLQEQYMKHGQYDSSMSKAKIQKRKVVDLGEKIVLDTERCILCTRCVRFTEEVTKTHDLGIFKRGDESEISTVASKEFKNDYSLNTVDICPVGALTSKDFRFKQRVWYLKNTDTTCPGCSTGCSVKVYHNEEGLFRLEPREDLENNTYWMCDEGREVYKYVNKESRLTSSFVRSLGKQDFSSSEVRVSFFEFLESQPKTSLILTGQNTNEDYLALKENFKDAEVFYWQNNPETFSDFDGLLKRGDKNPNTKGLKQNFSSLQKLEDFKESELNILVLPENHCVYPDFEEKLEKFKNLKNLLVFSVVDLDPSFFQSENLWLIPLKTFIEKNGTYTNHQAQKSKIKKGLTIVNEAYSIEEFFEVPLQPQPDQHQELKSNHFLEEKTKWLSK